MENNTLAIPKSDNGPIPHAQTPEKLIRLLEQHNTKTKLKIRKEFKSGNDGNSAP